MDYGSHHVSIKCDGGEESSVACINYILGTTPEVYREETGHNALCQCTIVPLCHCTIRCVVWKTGNKKTGYSHNAEESDCDSDFRCIARCVAVEIFNI